MMNSCNKCSRSWITLLCSISETSHSNSHFLNSVVQLRNFVLSRSRQPARQGQQLKGPMDVYPTVELKSLPDQHLLSTLKWDILRASIQTVHA
jgi:hypothetical protein